GTLRDPAIDEPTLEECHPRGTRYGCADAPVAVTFFPYNRSDAYACNACGRTLLRYTEDGGYYVDHRVRELLPELVLRSRGIDRRRAGQSSAPDLPIWLLLNK
ncbi:MAG: hypothetical protein ABIR35_12870, partial [Polaromonas sp.]